MNPYPKRPMAFFLYYVRFYWKLYAVILFLLFFRLFLQKMDPYIFSKIIDILVDFHGSRSTIWQEVTGWLVLMIVLSLCTNGIRRLVFYLIQQMEPDLGVRVKRDMTSYILGHSVGFLNNLLSGKVAARVDQLSDGLIRMFWDVSFGFYYPMLDISITIFLLATVNIGFALLFVFWMGLLLFILLKSSSKIKRYSEIRAEKSTTSSGTIVDMISNSALVKTFANFAFEKKMLEPKLAEEKKASEVMISNIFSSLYFTIGLPLTML